MISIIMPVFNTAGYLKNAIDGIIGQTYDDWELICINDGSTDDTPDILGYYSKLDQRIKVISQENKGAGLARNAGLGLASGEYVTFLDSDDQVMPEFLMSLYETITEHDADVSICNISINDGENTIHCDKSSGIPEGIFEIRDLGDSAFFDCRNVVWNKLIRRKLVLDKGIHFQNLTSSNDVYFSCMTILQAGRIAYSDASSCIVHCISRKGQISEHRNPQNFIKCVDKLIVDADNYLVEVGIRRKIIELFLRGGLDELRRAPNNYVRELFYDSLVEYLMNHADYFEPASFWQTFLKAQFLSKNYDSGWWKVEEFFFIQMMLKKAEIEKILRESCRPCLWGMGKRGRLFLEYCRKENMKMYAVTDKCISKAYAVIEKLSNTPAVMDTVKVIHEADLIIASNRAVYRYVNKLTDVKIVNLEDYCPIV